jgi:ADP-ribose pyrophosphatase YjhB (NUDIX family)
MRRGIRRIIVHQHEPARVSQRFEQRGKKRFFARSQNEMRGDTGKHRSEMPHSANANLHVHLATALLRRDDEVLLVASRYPNHAEPLWNLPGGRQQSGELLRDTAVRELREETGLTGAASDLCYVSESYDGEMHIMNFTFAVSASGDLAVPQIAGDHVIDAAWVPVRTIAQRITVGVVREPLLAFLNGELPARYAGYPVAGITIEFPD